MRTKRMKALGRDVGHDVGVGSDYEEEAGRDPVETLVCSEAEQYEAILFYRNFLEDLQFLPDLEEEDLKEGSGLEIFVKTASGQTVSVGRLGPEDATDKVKSAVYDKRHRLTVAGKQLEAGRDLAEYDIQRHSVLFETSRLHGDGKRARQAMMTMADMRPKADDEADIQQIFEVQRFDRMAFLASLGPNTKNYLKDLEDNRGTEGSAEVTLEHIQHVRQLQDD